MRLHSRVGRSEANFGKLEERVFKQIREDDGEIASAQPG
jgi:hypothetical protein